MGSRIHPFGLHRTLWPLIGMLALLLTAWPSQSVSAQALGVTYQNAINLGGGCYRLTNASNGQRGAVWYFGTVDVSQSWEMTADVYLGTNNGGADGDGFRSARLRGAHARGRGRAHGLRRKFYRT